MGALEILFIIIIIVTWTKKEEKKKGKQKWVSHVVPEPLDPAPLSLPGHSGRPAALTEVSQCIVTD